VSKIVIVSNRLPVKTERHDGKLAFTPSVGGLATGLGSFYRSRDSVWIGWPGIASDELTEQDRTYTNQQLEKKNCHPVFLSQQDLNEYYYGFCNKTIWPLFHYFPLYTSYADSFWRAYERVNAAFCEAVVDTAEPGDTIWIQDYHLLLLPGLIRERLPKAKIGFFLHIPFPSSEVFRLLPWRTTLLNHLLGADLIGFHTYDYVRHFLASVRRILGYSQISASSLVIAVGDRVVKADAFPMGIDYEHFARTVTEPETERKKEQLRDKIGDRKVILSVDRLDYTKGLTQRLDAFDLFLDEFPQYREKVTLVLKVIASRAAIDQYQQLKKRLDERVGRINGKHGSLGWMPVWYLYRFLPERELIALYSLADVALLTPLRDGMNLIAKEFLAAKFRANGMLILSEMAGAAKELPESLLVNPNNLGEIAAAINTALTMPEDEQSERTQLMQKRLQRYNVVRWAEDFIGKLSSIKHMQSRLDARRLGVSLRPPLIEAYRSGKSRLLLLDYDGTLVSFTANPAAAHPDDDLMNILSALTQAPGTEVVIISGRDKGTLQRWFGTLSMGLIAEHGVWIKGSDEGWRTIEQLSDDWKTEIRPLLDLYVDRTPGSFLEEKEFSLVWHYRKADEEFAEVRVGELKEDLAPLVDNRNLGVFDGNHIIEVKNAGINKGRAALTWTSKKDWDFILAVGDDRTDEDTFSVLPGTAYSVKVGLQPSQARFNLESPREVRSLLRKLAEAGGASPVG
jgi:trehalose 6-phosphate synthase/phosphatase